MCEAKLRVLSLAKAAYGKEKKNIHTISNRNENEDAEREGERERVTIKQKKRCWRVYLKLVT